MTNLLSRVYNSTLGIPQQVLYRTLRALQDEDIDLFSREGIVAPELMPLLGVMASHETDATVEEVFGDRGGVANFLTDMLTDPATYLTAGVTGIAKAGKSVRAAQVGGGMKKGKRLADQGIDVNKFRTAGELREALHAGLQEGSLKGRAVKRAARDLGEVGGNTLIEDIVKTSAKEDLLITIPGLARWGASKKAPAPLQKHKSWFALQNHLFYKKPLEKMEPVWRWMGNGIRGMGDVGDMVMDGLADIAAVPKAFKLGASALESAFTAKVGEFGNDELAAAKWRVLYGSASRKLQKTDIQQVVKRVREKIAAGAPLEEIVKTRGIPKELREQILKWPKSKTNPVATENIAEPLGKYLNEIRVEGKRADRILEKAKTDFVRREMPDLGTGHWSAEVAYNAGQGLRKFREKMLHRGNPDTSEWIKELQDEHLKREAQGRLILEGKQKALIERVERIAEAEGMSVEEVSRVLNIHTEGAIHPLDLGATMKAIRSDKEEERLAGAQHLVDFLGRARGTVEALRGITRLDKRTERMLDALDSATLDILNSEGRHFSRHEMVRLEAEQLGPRMASRFAGKRIHELSMEDLDELRHTDAVLDPELRSKIRSVRKNRPKVKDEALVRFDVGKATQSRRLQDLDADDLKAAIDATDDPKLRRTLRDTLRRQRQGLPPKKAFVDQEVEVPFVLGELTPEMQTLADYMLALGDLKQGRFTSLTLERLERGTQALGRMVPEQAKAVFKKADADDLDFVFGLSDDAARLAHQANSFSMGAPLGYLPRLRNGRRERKLRDLLGQVDKTTAGLKGVSSNFKKRLEQGRSLTLEEIGTKMDELEKTGPEGKKLAKELGDLLEAEGLKPGKYIDDHVDLMMARMSRDFEQYNSARLVDDFFGHEASMQTGTIGGRIVQLLDANHQQIKHSNKRTKFKADDKGVRIGTKQDESIETARYMVVEQPDGTRALVDLHEVRRDKMSIELMDDTSDSVGQAFVAHQLGGARLNALEDARPGQWVVAGGDDMLQMFRSQVAPEPSKFAEAWAVYDWVNFGLKKFQTVLRPAHHVGNLISGIFQSQAAGASVGSIAMGHYAVAQVMFGLGDAANVPKSMSRAAGFKGELKTGRDSARMVFGAVTGKRLDDLDEVGSIKLPSGDEITHEDLWMGAVESGLLSGTFARQDVKVGGRTNVTSFEKSGELERLRYADDKTWQEGVTKFWDDALATTQVPEMSARMATVYALVFDGHKVEDAYELARRAHVDYSTLGIGERQILKRLIPYYTFGRKYIPWSLERMARDPKLASQWVTTLEQNGNMGVDSNGKIVYEKGKFQADMGRMNANLDALMSVMGAAEHLLPGEVATVKGVQSVEPPAFMAVGGGGFPGIIKDSIGDEGLEADSAAKALLDATFVGRLGEQAITGDLEALDSSLLSMVLPARFNNDPKQAALFQSNMAKRQLRRLELMAQEATSASEVRELREEALRIREALLTTQKDFGSR